MSRYYSLEMVRQAAHDVTLQNGAKHRCVDPDALLDIKPADVRENVKGEWQDDREHNCYLCSVCGLPGLKSFGFCPNCGADMRGES